MLILKKVKCENITNLFIQKIGHMIAQIVSLVLLMDILERHVNHFFKDMMSPNLLKLLLWFLTMKGLRATESHSADRAAKKKGIEIH